MAYLIFYDHRADFTFLRNDTSPYQDCYTQYDAYTVIQTLSVQWAVVFT